MCLAKGLLLYESTSQRQPLRPIVDETGMIPRPLYVHSTNPVYRWTQGDMSHCSGTCPTRVGHVPLRVGHVPLCPTLSGTCPTVSHSEWDMSHYVPLHPVGHAVQLQQIFPFLAVSLYIESRADPRAEGRTMSSPPSLPSSPLLVTSTHPLVSSLLLCSSCLL